MTPVEIPVLTADRPRFDQHGGVAPTQPSQSILCVDDDPNILAALQRQFRKTFAIETAIGPEQGLAAIAEKGPFAVVMSDLRMPGMNGIQFLTAVRTLAPDTVRVMLTGQADLADAIAAVNQGAIFRFLLKPSNPIILAKVIESALEQHRLIVAERHLLQQTLVGCVEVLAEVLSIIEPVAFSRTTRVLRYVRHLAAILNLTDSWQVEAAAMLSQIGWITFPTDIAQKASSDQPLSPEQSLRFLEHPGAAARIIERIPRLQTVAKIVESQCAPYQATAIGLEPDAPRDLVRFSASVLRAAIDFDERRRRGMSYAATLADMHLLADQYHPQVIAALTRIEAVELAEWTKAVSLDALAPGMIIEEDLCVRTGMCLIGRGQQLTPTSLQRLAGFCTP